VSAAPGTISQHPLAYLLGLDGIALLRAFTGAYDRDFTLARIDEIRKPLESPDAFGSGAEARPVSASEGYDDWAPSYDDQPNQLLARQKLPDADLHEADLDELPLADDSVDLVVCAIALVHVRELVPLGFRVLACEEPRVPAPLLDAEGRTVHDGARLPRQDPDEPPSTWALHAEAIDATNAAYHGKPSSIIWHFQLDR
jgi:hypothetical protein